MPEEQIMYKRDPYFQNYSGFDQPGASSGVWYPQASQQQSIVQQPVTQESGYEQQTARRMSTGGSDKQGGTGEPGNFGEEWLTFQEEGVTGLLENLGFADPEKYSKFIQEYDDYLEGRARQTYGYTTKRIGAMESQYKDQRSLLYENYNQQLGSLFESMNAARSKSGFVSSGGLDRRQGIGAEMVRNEFGGKRGAINTQLDLLGVEREQAGFQRNTSIEDARRKYISDFYNKALQMLQSGAELEGSTTGETTRSNTELAEDFITGDTGAGIELYTNVTGNDFTGDTVLEDVNDLAGIVNTVVNPVSTVFQAVSNWLWG